MGTAIEHVAFAELQDQLRGRERRATLARSASSVSHALATPLSVISGRVAMLSAAAAQPAEVERQVRIIHEQLSVVSEALQRLVAFSQTEQRAPEPVDLLEVMQQAVDVMQAVASQREITLVCTARSNPQAASDRNALIHLLTTIVSAVVLGCSRPNTVSLELSSTRADPPPRERGRARPGEHACFSIRCPGLRLPAATLDDPYQPWFASRATRDTHIELAFAVAWEIARENGGWVQARVDSASETVLLVSWPLCSR